MGQGHLEALPRHEVELHYLFGSRYCHVRNIHLLERSLEQRRGAASGLFLSSALSYLVSYHFVVYHLENQTTLMTYQARWY